jgi:hypothetical protein
VAIGATGVTSGTATLATAEEDPSVAIVASGVTTGTATLAATEVHPPCQAAVVGCHLLYLAELMERLAQAASVPLPPAMADQEGYIDGF